MPNIGTNIFANDIETKNEAKIQKNFSGEEEEIRKNISSIIIE